MFMLTDEIDWNNTYTIVKMAPIIYLISRSFLFPAVNVGDTRHLTVFEFLRAVTFEKSSCSSSCSSPHDPIDGHSDSVSPFEMYVVL